MDAEQEFRRGGNRVLCVNKKERWDKDNEWGRSKISWKLTQKEVSSSVRGILSFRLFFQLFSFLWECL